MSNSTGSFFNSWYEKLIEGKKVFRCIGEDGDERTNKKLCAQILSYKKIIILSALKKCPYKSIIEEYSPAATENKISYKHIKIWSDEKDTPLHDID